MMRGVHPFRIGAPAAASLLVNALLIVALLNLGLGHTGNRAESPALKVMSLAVLKGVEDGEAESEAAMPSEPMATPSPAEPVPDPSTPPSVQPVTAPVVTLPFALPRPVSAPAVAATAPTPVAARPAAASAPSAAIASTAPAAPPARRGVADGLDANAPSGTSRSYAAKVRSWLYAHKIYPRRARMRREEGKVLVRFVIDRAGMLIEGVIISGSGNGILDEEAAAMMRRASPFPRAPADVPGERIEFSAPIDFILPV